MSTSEQAPSSRALLEPALAALLRLARLASHHAGAEEVLPALVDAAVRQLGAEAAAALRLDASGAGIVVAAVGESLGGVRIEVEALDRSVGERLQGACSRAYAVVHTLPLASDSDLFGALVLFFDRADALDAGKLKFASGLTELAATSLAKAARYEALERALAQRNEAQTKLRATIDHLEALIDTAGSVILFLSPEGIVLEFNRTAAELHGCSREDAVGKNYLTTFVAAGGREAARTELANVLGGARTRGFESEVLTNGGETRTLLWNADRLIDDDGVAIGVVAVGQDITERKRLQAELIHAQKLEALGQLATGVAHDFNNVLTIITGLADVAMGMLPAASDARTYIGELKAAGMRGAVLTKQLKAFGRPRKVVQEIVDLNQTVSSSEAVLRQAVRHRVELVLRLEATDARVRVDSGQLEQVLLNLVLNARDAMPEGGKVTVETAVVAGAVVLAVIDTGVGMSDAIKQRVFEPFFTTKGELGTGLGLSMVRGFVERAGAHMDVESSPGHGTTFRIRFPVAEGEPMRALTLATPAPSVGRPTVLVVDDQESARRALRLLLSDRYDILEAASGEAALEQLAGDKLDVLLTDIELGSMPVVQVVDGVRKRFPDALVVYVSGYESSDPKVIDALGVPRSTFVPKPVDIDTLTATIDRLLTSG